MPPAVPVRAHTPLDTMSQINVRKSRPVSHEEASKLVGDFLKAATSASSLLDGPEEESKVADTLPVAVRFHLLAVDGAIADVLTTMVPYWHVVVLLGSLGRRSQMMLSSS